MKRKTLISLILILVLLLPTGCYAKKNDKNQPEERKETAITTEAGSEEKNTETEADPTPEYVEEYTVEVREDEVFEIH